MRRIDLTGQTFGRLTVLSMTMVKTARRNVAHCICSCECGGIITTLPHSLKSMATKSCGCLLSEVSASRQTTHNQSNTPTWSVWCAMRRRCDNPRNKSYGLYGGRGITVCERWQDFSNFLADMGERPSRLHSIERQNTNGNYEPGNCVWATKAQQSRNTRRNVVLTHNGKTMVLQDWADFLGVHRCTLERRLRKGWPIHKVLSE